jgi:Mannosyltransferase (PIG-V)
VVLIALWTASRLVPDLDLGTAVTAWDGGWYLSTAKHGYPHGIPLTDGHAGQSTIAFFPLYPLSVRAVHALGFSYLTAGLLVAGTAGMATVVLLWLLLRRLWGGEAADRGVTLFCFFPGALVLSLTYSEPLMLALTIGSLLALLSQRWITAGVLAALATASRPNAIALVAACAWAAVVAIRTRRQWRALAAPLLAPLGFVVFQGFLWARTGAADAWFRTQHEGWEERLALGAAWHRIEETIHHPLSDVNHPVAVAGTLIMAVTLVLLIRARPPAPVLVYTIGVVLLALMSETLGARPRFVLTAFPLVVAPARWLRGNGFAIAVACSATVLGSFTIISVASLLATP